MNLWIDQNIIILIADKHDKGKITVVLYTET